MRIGLPRETKDGECRMALGPASVRALTRAGHQVRVEHGAGLRIGFRDADFEQSGAILVAGHADAFDADLIVKVKELQAPEYALPRAGQTLFGFQHFAPEPGLLDAALASGAMFVAYETVGEASGLPILAPMSAIAGRLAVQMGAWCLQMQNGGSGVLLAGLDGVAPGHVAILGAGNVGANALCVAHGIGARATVFASSGRRLAALRARYPERTEFRIGTHSLAALLPEVDLVIAGVLVPGSLSPILITRRMLAAMREGSAFVDVGIDQGGVAETSRITSHSDPTYVEEGVVHYCVPNMPAACARTASLALEAAVWPYVQVIAEHGLAGALARRSELASGVQVARGRLTHPYLARDTNRALVPLEQALG